ncbi:invasion protein IalB [Azospirillum agricola]|uniref:hypothetical protein n=1 Tax=Azospirillum agricola TaxID=1720247 RepID=UPI001AE4A826|nr:hypothetical protein [Azospirillum agricola]MBP2231390.1 invasion protein IalB [Azospirillum agricola]
MTGTARWWRGTLLGLVALAAAGLAPSGRAAEPPPALLPSPPDGRAFLEHEESVKGWKLYCRTWTATRRVECELSARGINDRTARLVWLRSTERWLDGLRFRVEAEALELGRPVRVWVDRGLFRPEFPCKPFPFETNTCAVADPDTNRKLVDRLSAAQEVSVVGQSPSGAKAEVRFPLAGFKAALERSEEIRAAAGTPWMTAAPPNGG